MNIPIGTINMFHNKTNIPSGWKICNGQSVSKSTIPNSFAELVKVLAPLKLQSKGVTNSIYLPDLRNYFIKGVGSEEIGSNSKKPDSHSHSNNLPNNFSTTQDGKHSHSMPSSWSARQGSSTSLSTSSGGLTYIDPRSSLGEITSNGLHNHSVTFNGGDAFIIKGSLNSNSSSDYSWGYPVKYYVISLIIFIGLS